MKRMLSILLTVCMLLSMVPTVLAAETDPKIPGCELTWNYNEQTQHLTIEGTGDMTDFKNSNQMPWYGYRSAIKSVKIAEGVTSIGQYAFNAHSALTDVIIPNSVTSIGDSAFYGCTNLQTAAIGNGVAELGYQAFAQCGKLVAVTIGSGVTKIARETFKNCSAITEVYYMGTDEEWENVTVEPNNGALYKFPVDKIFYMDPPAAGTSKDVNWSYDPLTFTLTISGEGAMADYKDTEQDWYDYRKAMQTIIIENGVTTIGATAFRYCQMVDTVYIPATVTAIHDDAFAYCKGLEDVYYSSSEEDWNAITKGANVSYLTAADIHFAGDCAHTNVSEKVIAKGDMTHTVQVICACGTIVRETEPEACGDEDADGKCEFCGGEVELTCNGTDHPKTEVYYDPADKETDVEDIHFHHVVLRCTVCEAEVGEAITEACSDGSDEDTLCDNCKVGTPCSHVANASDKPVCNNDNTHTEKKTCGICSLVYDTKVVPCSDEDKNNVCDKCEGEVEAVYYIPVTDEGVLTIYGKGAMEDYASFTGMPWSDDRESVKKIVIKDGVTHIGARSFYRCINATEVEIADSVETIGDSAFYRCDSLKNVEFGGDKAQWETLKKETGTNNEKLTGADVAWVCSHPETTTVSTPNADSKTHTETTTCTECSYVKTENVDCTASEPFYTKGEDNKHTVTVKCKVCEQVLSETAEECSFATVPADNGDRTHTVIKTCTKCTAASTATEKCADGEDEDTLCDLCKAELACNHEEKFTFGYRLNGDNLTHTPYMFCNICNEPVYPVGDAADCEAEEGFTCKLCGQDFSCQHPNTNVTYEYIVNADRTHTVITIITCANAECDEKELSRETATETTPCTDVKNNETDEDGKDDYCDVCGADLTCLHAVQKVEHVHNEGWTHQMQIFCETCGDKLADTPEDCVNRAGNDDLCDKCGKPCDHSYTYVYNKIESVEEHNAKGTCVHCGNKVDFNEACVDVTSETTVHDGVCDKEGCGGTVTCKHEEEITYINCENGVHTAVKTCDTCAAQEDSCAACAAYWADPVEGLCVDGEDDDYTCDECETAFAAAAVNTKAYNTFASAMAAAEAGATITLLKDVTLTEQLNIAKELNLDFGEYTLTTCAAGYDYSVKLRANVTIEDGIFDLAGVYGIQVYPNVTLTVNGGEFNVEEINDYLIGNWGTTVINGGQFNGVYCAVNNFAGSLSITGGTFSTEDTDYTGEYPAADVYAGEDTTVAISGGVFSKPVEEAHCAEGLEPVDNGDGTYGVVESECQHEATTTTYTFDAATKTHTSATVCDACGETVATTEAERCTEANRDSKCDVCGGTIEVPAYGSNMTLGNALELNFLVRKAAVTGKTGLTAYLTHHAVNTETGVPEDVVYEYPQASWVLKGNYYYLSVRVAAAQMTDMVDLLITDADGYVYSASYGDSVQTYFDRLYAATKEPAAKPLMVDMLNYGASAQNYFSYKTDVLANAALTEEQQALATPAVDCVNAQEKDSNYYGTTLSLKDCIELNFIFKNLKGKDITKMHAEVSFTNSLGELKTATLSGDSLISQASGARVQVKVTEPVLADASELVSVTLYVDGVEFATAKDCVQSYVQRYVASKGDETGLYGNIMKLSKSALNYVLSK